MGYLQGVQLREASWGNTHSLDDVHTQNTVKADQLTSVLHGVYVVVANIEAAELAEHFEVLQLVDEVLVQVQTAQVSLGFQVLDALQSITLKPQTLQPSVFFQILYDREAFGNRRGFTLLPMH